MFPRCAPGDLQLVRFLVTCPPRRGAAFHARTGCEQLGRNGVTDGARPQIARSEIGGIRRRSLAHRVSIRSEVLYVDFVDRSQRFLFAPPATFATFTESDSAWIARLGLNIKFGGPVTASY